jgi:putative membrane protein
MLATIPNFLLFFTVAITLTVSFLALYVYITPYNEIRLIKDGNVASAISFSGTILGLAIVMYNCVVYSHSLKEMAVWGVVGLAIQLIAWVGINFAFGDLNKAISEDECVADGIILATSSIGVGIIQAACLVP